MNEKLIRACRQNDVKGAIMSMMTERNGVRFFGHSMIDNDVDFDNIVDVEELTISTEGFLNTMCEFNDVTKIVNNILHKKGEDMDDLECELEKRGFYDVEIKEPLYSYNWENDLSHDVQFRYLTLQGGNDDVYAYDCDKYILLEVHCGGDARTNLSTMVCFKLADDDYFGLGMIIQGFTSERDFETSSSIVNDCRYDRISGCWRYDCEEVSLYTPAQGF